MTAPFRRGRVPPAWSILAFAAIAGGFGPHPLAAEDEGSAVEADLQSRFTASSHLAGGGTVSQWSSSFDLSLPVAGSSADGLGVDLIADRLGFDFGGFGGFLPGKSAPLANASILTLQPTLVLTPAAPWSLIASALVQDAGADQASSNGATLWGGSVAAAYQWAPNLKIGLGLEGMQQMKAPVWYIPFPIIDWRISDRWTLTSVDGETGRLVCSVARTVSFFGQLEFEEQDIRLARSSSLPSGIIRYEAYPLSVGFQWKPRPHLTAALSVGEAIAQAYHFEDAQGRLLRDSARRAPAIGTLEIDDSF